MMPRVALIVALLDALMMRPLVVEAQAPVGASAQIRDASGRVLATAALREAASEVQISLTFVDRTALIGTHAIHIHEAGRCDAPDFLSTGAIFNPSGKQHGLRNPNGPMAGDLPNLVIGPAGVGIYNLSAPQVTLRPSTTSLLQPRGTALVIFDGGDDDKTQPEGNAGARIACGVIVAGASAFDAPPNSRPDVSGSVVVALMGVLLMSAGLVLRRAGSS